MQTSVDKAPMPKFSQDGRRSWCRPGGSDKFSPFQPVGIANEIVNRRVSCLESETLANMQCTYALEECIQRLTRRLELRFLYLK